jgi:hypothetical protein
MIASWSDAKTNLEKITWEKIFDNPKHLRPSWGNFPLGLFSFFPNWKANFIFLKK